MKMQTPLFPYAWKKASGLVFYMSLAAGIGVLLFEGMASLSFLEVSLPDWLPFQDSFLSDSKSRQTNNVMDEILTILLIVSGIIHGFSAEKTEDELIMALRLNALTWSLLANYSLLALATVFVFGLAYFNVMIVGMFGILILFNIRFAFLLYRHYAS
jgi:hypothetical protein